MGFGGISIWQLLIILAIIVLLFGTKKLRGMGGDLGSAIKGFRKAVSESPEDKAAQEEQANKAAEQQTETAALNQQAETTTSSSTAEPVHKTTHSSTDH